SQGESPDDLSLSRLADPGEPGHPVLRERGPAVNGLAAVVHGTLKVPGRRIGQRGDATRAPSQGPRPERAARSRSPAFRDWPQCDKPIHNSCCHCLTEKPTSYLPLAPLEHNPGSQPRLPDSHDFAVFPGESSHATVPRNLKLARPPTYACSWLETAAPPGWC